MGIEDWMKIEKDAGRIDINFTNTKSLGQQSIDNFALKLWTIHKNLDSSYKPQFDFFGYGGAFGSYDQLQYVNYANTGPTYYHWHANTTQTPDICCPYSFLDLILNKEIENVTLPEALYRREITDYGTFGDYQKPYPTLLFDHRLTSWFNRALNETLGSSEFQATFWLSKIYKETGSVSKGNWRGWWEYMYYVMITRPFKLGNDPDESTKGVLFLRTRLSDLEDYMKTLVGDLTGDASVMYLVNVKNGLLLGTSVNEYSLVEDVGSVKKGFKARDSDHDLISKGMECWEERYVSPDTPGKYIYDYETSDCKNEMTVKSKLLSKELDIMLMYSKTNVLEEEDEDMGTRYFIQGLLLLLVLVLMN